MEEKIKKFKELKATLTALYEKQEALASKKTEIKAIYNDSCERVNEIRNIIEDENFNGEKKLLEMQLQKLYDRIDFMQEEIDFIENQGKKNGYIILIFAFLAAALSFTLIPIPLSFLTSTLVLGSSLALFTSYKNKTIRTASKLSRQLKQMKKTYNKYKQQMQTFSVKHYSKNAKEEIKQARLNRRQNWDEYMTIHHEENNIKHEILFVEAEYSRLGIEIAEDFSSDCDLNLSVEERLEILDDLVRILLNEKEKVESKRYFFGTQTTND